VDDIYNKAMQEKLPFPSLFQMEDHLSFDQFQGCPYQLYLTQHDSVSPRCAFNFSLDGIDIVSPTFKSSQHMQDLLNNFPTGND
jgi:hypothetical protein